MLRNDSLSDEFTDIERAALFEESTFYNRVFTKIFNGRDDERECKEKVKQMAFIEIRFAENGGLEITKSPSFTLSRLVAIVGKSYYAQLYDVFGQWDTPTHA